MRNKIKYDNNDDTTRIKHDIIKIGNTNENKNMKRD